MYLQITQQLKDDTVFMGTSIIYNLQNLYNQIAKKKLKKN